MLHPRISKDPKFVDLGILGLGLANSVCISEALILEASDVAKFRFSFSNNLDNKASGNSDFENHRKYNEFEVAQTYHRLRRQNKQELKFTCIQLGRQ